MEYYKRLQAIVDVAHAAVGRLVAPIVPLLLPPEGFTRHDAPGSRLTQALDGAARSIVAATDANNLSSMTRQFANRTSEFQKGQLGAQVRAAVGVDLHMLEPNLAPALTDFAVRNVALIKTLPEDYFDDIRLTVEKGIASGAQAKTISKDMQARYGIASRRADLIARDQVGKLYGQLNGLRQQALGVTGYIWRGSLDNRERELHVDREGESFQWDDPPNEDETDGHPGQPINCRCYAEPDFSSILDDDQLGDDTYEGE